MINLKITTSVAETFFPLKSMNQNLIKVPKLLSQQIRKRYYKTLGTSVIKIPMSPPSPSQQSPANVFLPLLLATLAANPKSVILYASPQLSEEFVY